MRVRRYRERENSVTESPESVTNVTNSVTENVTVDVTQYPSILQALTDPIKRGKLQDICDVLGKRKLLHKVEYGCGGMSFDIVQELLEVTA